MDLMRQLHVRLINASLAREEGQTLVEYGLILALIAVVAVVALQLLGTNVTARLNSVANSIGA